MTEEYGEFTLHMKRKLGIDLALYKEKQMKRRVTSLRDKHGYTNFQSYRLAMEQNQLLLQEFIDRVTINVSEFYRNPKRWQVLKQKVMPMLVNRAKELTIWSTACSTGEEAYSLAMMVMEYFPNHACKIIATDIDEQALGKAKQGIYQEQALKDLPARLKNEYFTVQHGLYHVNPELKKIIQFKKLNLLADRYPGKVDLIVCRNVLIYFTEQAKEIIYTNFGRSLTDKGVLFVGSAEQIFTPQAYNLSLIDTFFYQKI